jgi:hypothetical protein
MGLCPSMGMNQLIYHGFSAMADKKRRRKMQMHRLREKKFTAK